MANSDFVLCGIENSYLTYLRAHDSTVSLDPTQNRKFIGVLFEINGFKYCAPLTSPKPKHARMSDKQPDIYKIDGGALGLINLNNMIPIFDEGVIIDIDIEQEKNAHYKALMKKQMIHLRKDEEPIKKKAKKLYSIVKSGKQPKLNDRCCKFLLLEGVASLYNTAQTAAAVQPLQTTQTPQQN